MHLVGNLCIKLNSFPYRGGRGGRGARGRREQRPTNYDVVATRPKELTSKAGTSGQPIGLITNYIRLKGKVIKILITEMIRKK